MASNWIARWEKHDEATVHYDEDVHSRIDVSILRCSFPRLQEKNAEFNILCPLAKVHKILKRKSEIAKLLNPFYPLVNPHKMSFWRKIIKKYEANPLLNICCDLIHFSIEAWIWYQNTIIDQHWYTISFLSKSPLYDLKMLNIWRHSQSFYSI